MASRTQLGAQGIPILGAAPASPPATQRLLYVRAGVVYTKDSAGAEVALIEGSDTRLTNARTPTGTAGGSLAGTYPNPSLAAGAVNSAEINAAIKDAAAATASLRTLGTGALQAAAGNHGHALTDANITGIIPDAQLPARIREFTLLTTDFNTATLNGFYTATNSAINAPITGQWWFLQVITYTNGADTVQRATKMSVGGETYERQRPGTAAWGAWTRVYQFRPELDALYILKAVSQTLVGRTELRVDTTATDWTAPAYTSGNNTGHPGYAFHVPNVMAKTLRLNRTTGEFEFVSQDGLAYSAMRAGLNANDLGVGTVPEGRLPLRIGPRGNSGGFGNDWNLAREPGWYSSDIALNAPGAGWWLTHVETHDNQAANLWVTQTAHAFADGGEGASDTKIWRRSCNGGAWQAWYRCRISEAELDARYSRTTHGGQEKAVSASGTSGTVTLDVSLGSVFYVSPTGNITTLTISNVPSGTTTSCTISLMVDGTAGTPSTATIVGPSGAMWMGSAAPAPVSGKARAFTFVTTNGGASWYCSGVVQV